MFRSCYWNRSPGCAPKLLAQYHLRQSVLYSQDYLFNGCSGGANGCEKRAKGAAGGRRGAAQRTRQPGGAPGGGQDGFVIEEHKWLCLVRVGVENGFVWCFRSGGFEVGGDEAGDGVRHAVTFRFEE